MLRLHGAPNMPPDVMSHDVMQCHDITHMGPHCCSPGNFVLSTAVSSQALPSTSRALGSRWTLTAANRQARHSGPLPESGSRWGHTGPYSQDREGACAPVSFQMGKQFAHTLAPHHHHHLAPMAPAVLRQGRNTTDWVDSAGFRHKPNKLQIRSHNLKVKVSTWPNGLVVTL